ncbi:hypothetical protein DMA11_15605 [Marinilabiliaceae bacterium JC017]|nr:hypothetical protein DMA11_15605 [Marinilabiliaceae bacterium JC017]
MLKQILFSFLLFTTPLVIFSQNNTSALADSTHNTSRLSISGNIDGSSGYLDETSFLDYNVRLSSSLNLGQHTFSAEGGSSAWYYYDNALETGQDNVTLRLLALNYRYQYKGNQLTLGLQDFQLGDQFILDERIMGLNYQLGRECWHFNMIVGTVSDHFSKNGSFNTTGNIYDSILQKDRPAIPESLGEANLWGATLEFHPQLYVPTEAGENDILKINTLGLVAYHEFGDAIESTFTQAGVYANLSLIGGIRLNPQVTLQAANCKNVLIYNVEVLKDVRWNSYSSTLFSLQYHDYSNEESMPLNTFSNQWLGEVVRMDMTNMPLMSFKATHKMNKPGLTVSLAAYRQLTDTPTQEYDLIISKTLFENFNIKGVAGWFDEPVSAKSSCFGRLALSYRF